MDLPNFNQMRYVRFVSHNGNSSAPDGAPSASNFNVVMDSDIQMVGEITAFSLDNITFPNVFPNVTDGNNLFYVRFELPDADGWRMTETTLTYTLQGGEPITTTLFFHYPIPPFNTVAQIALLNSDPLLPTFFHWFVGPYGEIILRSDIPVLLDPATFQVMFGFSDDMIQGYQTEWIGYPFQGGVFTPIVIPPGYYNNTQLAATLQAELIAATAGPFTVTVETIGANNYFFIQNLTETFYLVPLSQRGTGGIGVSELPNYRQLLFQMGYQPVGLPTTPYNAVVASLNPALQGEQIVYLHSQILSSSRKSYPGEGNPDSVIAAIPVNAPYGGIVIYSPNQWGDPGFVLERGITPRQFDFSLKNQYNENLDIGWNQTLSLFFRMFFDWRVPQ
jgi:hypothetical protein